jgi:hypothetical protein
LTAVGLSAIIAALGFEHGEDATDDKNTIAIDIDCESPDAFEVNRFVGVGP